MAAAIPIVLAYFPYGFAFGVLARQTGLTLLETLFMCLIVYAGSAQIMVLGLLQAGQAIGSIVLATFLFNLRFFLMSAALAPYVSDWSFFRRTLFGYQVADEQFALLSTKFAEEKPVARYAFAVNMTAYFAWACFSLLGFTAGGLVPDIRIWGLDYALPAVFIGLLIGLLHNRTTILVIIFSAALAVILNLNGLQRSSVMVTAMIGASLGAFCELWKKSSPSSS